MDLEQRVFGLDRGKKFDAAAELYVGYLGPDQHREGEHDHFAWMRERAAQQPQISAGEALDVVQAALVAYSGDRLDRIRIRKPPLGAPNSACPMSARK